MVRKRTIITNNGDHLLAATPIPPNCVMGLDDQPTTGHHCPLPGTWVPFAAETWVPFKNESRPLLGRAEQRRHLVQRQSDRTGLADLRGKLQSALGPLLAARSGISAT